jgi:hypothetical protein
MANMLSESDWQRVLPNLRSTFSRLSEEDLKDCALRVDLTVAKVQNRHWLDRITAQRQVLHVIQSSLTGVSSAP